MEGPTHDSAVLAAANALQVAVLTAPHEWLDEAFQRLIQVARNIPADLDQPHLAVLRSLLVIHTAHLSDTVAPHAHGVVFRRLCQAGTASSGQLRDLYLEVLSMLREARDGAPRTGAFQDHRVAAALDYVRSHCTDHPLRLGDVARAVHVSRWHLGRLILRDTGATFTRHVRNARLDAACRLLASSALSIKEVADRVGYPHVSEFTRDFKSGFNVAPREWRRRQSGA